jgi:hypothetical protein
VCLARVRLNPPSPTPPAHAIALIPISPLACCRADTTTAATPPVPIDLSRKGEEWVPRRRRSRLERPFGPSTAVTVEGWRRIVGFRGGGWEAEEGGDGAAVPDAPGGQHLQLQTLQNPPRPLRRHHLQGPSLNSFPWLAKFVVGYSA